MQVIEERSDGTRRVYTEFSPSRPEDVSRTKQSFHKETDINRIIAKYRKTGILGDPLNYNAGMYGDFSSGADFATRMRQIVRVEEIFSELPSPVRNRFSNDPAQLIDFLVDSNNDKEAVELGLKKLAVVVNDLPPAPVAPVVNV